MSALTTLLAQAPFLDPGGSDGSPGISPGTLIAVLGTGFLIAIAGHVVRSRVAVAFGIALVFGATVVVPVLARLAD